MSKVITVAQHKGGAGKTTIATHLAIGLAQNGYRVAALDTDPQGSMSSWYEARQRYGHEGMVEIGFSAFSDWWRVRPEIDRLRDNYDLVIIDCPPHTKDDAQKAVSEADLVVVPIQPSPTDLWATMKTIDLTNDEEAHTYLLLNRIISNSKLSRQFIEELPRCRFDATIGNRVAFSMAMGEGKAVTETESSSLAAQEICAVVDELESLLHEQVGTVSEDDYSMAS